MFQCSIQTQFLSGLLHSAIELLQYFDKLQLQVTKVDSPEKMTKINVCVTPVLENFNFGGRGGFCFYVLKYHYRITLLLTRIM